MRVTGNVIRVAIAFAKVPSMNLRQIKQLESTLRYYCTDLASALAPFID